MFDIDNLSNDEKIFLKEIQIYNNALITKEKSSLLNDFDMLKSSHDNLTDNYLNLLKLAIKLVKISDSSQLKLRNAQSTLKEQNNKIELQNNELLLSNQVKDKLFFNEPPNKKKLYNTLKKILNNINDVKLIPYEKRSFDF